MEPYKEKFAVFVMPDDIVAVQGSVDWLVQNSECKLLFYNNLLFIYNVSSAHLAK